jgi:SAM-dependent methyltransferase
MCDSADSRRKFEARDLMYGIKGSWWIRECVSCHSFFLENPPTDTELAALYPEESYYAYKIVPRSRVKRFLHALVGYSDAARDPEFERPGRVLDFGCGAGQYLLEMRERGWECAGVEISASARNEAHARDLDVRPDLGGPTGFPTAHFDYVRANHSLEHVSDPQRILRELHRVLKPGGLMFIGIPTASGLNASLFGSEWWYLTAPLHTFVPSTRALKTLVERTGFQVVQTTTNSDYGGTTGSLQARLNRGSDRRIHEGLIFSIKPLLILGHWVARLEDLMGLGDKLELTARKNS